jgi:hypothetical protein
MNEFAQAKQIENFTIISNRGHVDAINSRANKLTRKFYGTMIAWDFV